MTAPQHLVLFIVYLQTMTKFSRTVFMLFFFSFLHIRFATVTFKLAHKQCLPRNRPVKAPIPLELRHYVPVIFPQQRSITLMQSNQAAFFLHISPLLLMEATQEENRMHQFGERCTKDTTRSFPHQTPPKRFTTSQHAAFHRVHAGSGSTLLTSSRVTNLYCAIRQKTTPLLSARFSASIILATHMKNNPPKIPFSSSFNQNPTLLHRVSFPVTLYKPKLACKHVNFNLTFFFFLRSKQNRPMSLSCTYGTLSRS